MSELIASEARIPLFVEPAQAVPSYCIEQENTPTPQSPWQRIGAIVALSAVLASGACTAASENQANATPSHSVSTVPNPQSEGKGGRAQGVRQLIVQPVTLEADGFAPAEYPDGMLKDRATAGWWRLQKASNGNLTTNLVVDVQPVRTLKVPGITAVPNLCDDVERTRFDDAVMNAITDTPDIKNEAGRTTTIAVLEMKKDPSCRIATAAGGIIVYDGNNMPDVTYTHEYAHLESIGHDQLCSTPVQCTTYGNPNTIMGASSDGTDPDPFTGFALTRLGAISPSEIMTIGSGPHTVELSALNNISVGASTKLIKIPMVGLQGNGLLTCADNIYLELSGNGNYADSDGQLYVPVSVKAYALNERGWGTDTFLLPFRPAAGKSIDHEMGLEAIHLGKPVALTVGNTSFSVLMTSLEQGGTKREATGMAKLTLNVLVHNVDATKLPDCTMKGGG